MIPTPYDFRKPGPLASGVEPHVNGWHRRGCALATRNWKQRLPFPLEVHYEAADLVTAAEALANLPESMVGYPLTLQQSITTVQCWPRTAILGIVMGLLGAVPAETPAVRELTTIEDSLFDFFLKDLLTSSWLESWLGLAACKMCFETKEPNPRWGKWYPAEESMIVANFRLVTPFGDEAWQWLLPTKPVVAALNPNIRPIVEVGTPVPQRLEALIQSMPMDMTVMLGSAELLLSQLANLGPGDLIVLNQRVTQPLTAWLGGKKQLTGWPGKVGGRQALQIHTLEGEANQNPPPGERKP